MAARALIGPTTTAEITAVPDNGVFIGAVLHAGSTTVRTRVNVRAGASDGVVIAQLDAGDTDLATIAGSPVWCWYGPQGVRYEDGLFLEVLSGTVTALTVFVL